MLSNILFKLHHLFIPSERNNFRAKLLHIDFLSFYLCLALFVSFSYRTLATNNLGSVLGIATDITVDKLYQLTNQERGKEGLSSLKYNAQLAAAACGKANYMFANNLWAHYGTDGTTPWSFILNAGYRYRYAGENLAKDFMASDGVMQGWMNSPTHRENVMRKEYKDIGFCVANGTLNGEETTLVVQMFGSPQAGQNGFVRKVAAAEKKVAVATPSSKGVEIASTELVQNHPQGFNINLAKLPFNLSLMLFSLLLIALFFDFYFAHRLGVMRVVGKHMAHFIFLGFVLISLFIVTSGAIL